MSRHDVNSIPVLGQLDQLGVHRARSMMTAVRRLRRTHEWRMEWWRAFGPGQREYCHRLHFIHIESVLEYVSGLPQRRTQLAQLARLAQLESAIKLLSERKRLREEVGNPAGKYQPPAPRAVTARRRRSGGDHV